MVVSTRLQMQTLSLTLTLTLTLTLSLTARTQPVEGLRAGTGGMLLHLGGCSLGAAFEGDDLGEQSHADAGAPPLVWGVGPGVAAEILAVTLTLTRTLILTPTRTLTRTLTLTLTLTLIVEGRPEIEMPPRPRGLT